MKLNMLQVLQLPFERHGCRHDNLSTLHPYCKIWIIVVQLTIRFGTIGQLFWNRWKFLSKLLGNKVFFFFSTQWSKLWRTMKKSIQEKISEFMIDSTYWPKNSVFFKQLNLNLCLCSFTKRSFSSFQNRTKMIKIWFYYYYLITKPLLLAQFLLSRII